MWQIPKRAKVFLCLDPVDMRKSFDGLSIWVADALERSPMSGDLFVFSNRRRKIIKILYYDRNGFCIWSKRLSKHRFRWPKDEASAKEIRKHELAWLLDGLDMEQAHEKLDFDTVC